MKTKNMSLYLISLALPLTSMAGSFTCNVDRLSLAEHSREDFEVKDTAKQIPGFNTKMLELDGLRILVTTVTGLDVPGSDDQHVVSVEDENLSVGAVLSPSATQMQFEKKKQPKRVLYTLSCK